MNDEIELYVNKAVQRYLFIKFLHIIGLHVSAGTNIHIDKLILYSTFGKAATDHPCQQGFSEINIIEKLCTLSVLSVCVYL
mgnify:CR=1 FL=1